MTSLAFMECCQRLAVTPKTLRQWLAQAEMSEVLRVVGSWVDLAPVREEPDPVVLRGITLAPKHGVRVRVIGRRDAGSAEASAVAV